MNNIGCCSIGSRQAPRGRFGRSGPVVQRLTTTLSAPAKIAARGGTMAGVLSGVRVLDLSRVVSGPWCTQILADLGAEVIKIERPDTGDDTRQMGPFLEDADRTPTNDSAIYMACNRGKRSVTVDISTAGRRRARARSCEYLRCLRRELQGRFAGEVRPRLRRRPRRAREHRLLLDHGLRARRALFRASGLRLHHAGHVRPDEHDGAGRRRARVLADAHRDPAHRHGRPASMRRSPCWRR